VWLIASLLLPSLLLRPLLCPHSPYVEEGDLYHVPPLGRHYSLQWAVEDLAEERSEGGRMMENIEPSNRGGGSWQKESGGCGSGCGLNCRKDVHPLSLSPSLCVLLSLQSLS